MDTAALPGKGEPLAARFLSGGTQNVIFEITRGEHRCVLRMPPPGAPPERDKGILREWRIIEALDGTDVPHTAAVALCADPSVLGRPFYLMGFVDGWSPMDTHGRWPEPFHSDPSTRPELSYQLAEGIARLSKVDWRAKGLHDLGRPDGFHERQVDRWIGFLERIKKRPLPGLDAATGWLKARKPLDFIPGLMHGDYQFANVMYCHGAPARMAAIVDWEMGTVGDPKLDLGWMVQSWPSRTQGAHQAEGDDPGDMSYVDMRGMPSRDDVVAHYAEVSGRQVDDLDYYLVLAKWKLAIVLEQGFQRADNDEKLLAFGPVVTSLMASAADLAESSDYRG
ncbi:phosphotransferase family protein [Mycolicibacterium iranicum]|uniref:Acyl-CoA dehydrogenase n=1 Tax=Mycolicibacterium iranicum TaxID=912594 RepID=A0A178LY89_MYCIR|nr:phosphotransferase family protein [Mycolicibacterium iranicum]OAN38810.1 acyl-CoA dehydrogenase [Mycolicibacterium iranicum]